MAEIDVQNDLKAVTEKMEALVDELNKVNAHREQLVGQVQNLQGVLMYLRGKDDSPEVINEGGVPEEVVEAAKEAIKGKQEIKTPRRYKWLQLLEQYLIKFLHITEVVILTLH